MNTNQPASTAQPANQTAVYRWRLRVTAMCLIPAVVGWALSVPHRLDATTSFQFQVVGLLLLVAGIALRIWSAACICGKKSTEVVDVGPYSLCRNPLYIGTLLIVGSFAVLLHSLLLALAILPPVVLYIWGVVPAEERWLYSLHGSAFLEYGHRVPRWWPRFRSFKPRPRGVPFTQGFWAEVQGAGWWLALAALTQSLMLARTWPWWPHFWNVP